MATTVQNPFDTQQASATNTGIIGSAIQPSSATQTTESANNTTIAPAPAANSVSSYNPTTREINQQTGTVQGQVNSILANDSPLMQRARTLATQSMAQRGLVNSSMNAGAGVAAMTDKATQIGAQDANAYNQAASENMAAKNTSGQFNAGESNKFGLQTGQQQFEAGQAQIGREFATSERVGSQTFTSGLEVAKQNFSAAQAQLDRAQQTSLTDKSIEAQQALQTAQQNFAGAQSALDRTQQTALQTGQQTFTAAQTKAAQDLSVAQAALDRAQQVALADKSVAAQQALQTAQQNFAGAQADLDRTQQISMQNDQQAFTETQLKTDQAFKAAQSSLDRDQQISIQNDQQAFTEALNKTMLPVNFATQISSTTAQSVNAIAADPNLSGTADGYIDPATNKFVSGTVPAAGYITNGVFISGRAPIGSTAVSPVASSPKSRAIQSALNYANAQISWANTFYGATIPTMKTSG